MQRTMSFMQHTFRLKKIKMKKSSTNMIKKSWSIWMEKLQMLRRREKTLTISVAFTRYYSVLASSKQIKLYHKILQSPFLYKVKTYRRFTMIVRKINNWIRRGYATFHKKMLLGYSDNPYRTTHYKRGRTTPSARTKSSMESQSRVVT